MAADASTYRVGAVVSHMFPDGTKKPFTFASGTLPTSEKNYAQLEKEAVFLVFVVKKIYLYLHCRRFTLITNH